MNKTIAILVTLVMVSVLFMIPANAEGEIIIEITESASVGTTGSVDLPIHFQLDSTDSGTIEVQALPGDLVEEFQFSQPILEIGKTFGVLNGREYHRAQEYIPAYDFILSELRIHFQVQPELMTINLDVYDDWQEDNEDLLYSQTYLSNAPTISYLQSTQFPINNLYLSAGETYAFVFTFGGATNNQPTLIHMVEEDTFTGSAWTTDNLEGQPLHWVEKPDLDFRMWLMGYDIPDDYILGFDDQWNELDVSLADYSFSSTDSFNNTLTIETINILESSTFDIIVNVYDSTGRSIGSVRASSGDYDIVEEEFRVGDDNATSEEEDDLPFFGQSCSLISLTFIGIIFFVLVFAYIFLYAEKQSKKKEGE